jgi:hypothetical protein
MYRFFTLFLMILFAYSLWGQTPTFHADVAPIIYSHCAQCHRKGEIGPIPFTTYEEVSNYGAFIAHVTSTGYMPPWTPDPEYTSFMGERSLSQDEIDLLATWHKAGMPEGNPQDNPGLPNFPEGSQVGIPDLVIQMPEPYLHEGDMTEQYQVFLLETGVTEETEIRAVEIITDNSAIAHHALLGYTDRPSSILKAEALDAADPEQGYEHFGDYGVNVEDHLFGTWGPGSPPRIFPSSIGKIIQPNGRFLLQIHCGPTAVDESILTHVNLFFADKPIKRKVKLDMWLPSSLSEPFFIPPNEIKTFYGSKKLGKDISILSIFPHCHMLGQSWEVFAVSENEKDTIPLISIPEFDFNWQGPFSYSKLKHIPANYTIPANCTYDNTKNNPFNPNVPPQPMVWGELTSDEMFLNLIQYVDYLPGDEDISLEDTEDEEIFSYEEDRLFPAWPSPVAANDFLRIAFYLKERARVAFEFMNSRGQILVSRSIDAELPEGIQWESFKLTCPPGSYSLRMTTTSGSDQSIQIEVTD